MPAGLYLYIYILLYYIYIIYNLKYINFIKTGTYGTSLFKYNLASNISNCIRYVYSTIYIYIYITNGNIVSYTAFHCELLGF